MKDVTVEYNGFYLTCEIDIISTPGPIAPTTGPLDDYPYEEGEFEYEIVNVEWQGEAEDFIMAIESFDLGELYDQLYEIVFES